MNIYNLLQFYSYWLFIWFILYKLELTTYNPICSFSIALVVISICVILKRKLMEPKVLLLFVIQIAYLKFLPILFLDKEIKKENLKVELIVFIIYNLFLLINGTNLLQVYSDLFETLRIHKYETLPFTNLFINLYNYFFEYTTKLL
jgi:hypothetical protein